MEEILELQRQLAAVQQTNVVHALSERNAIDIIQQLRAAGKIDVFFTLNGKDFLTPRQLQLEVKDELLVAGGRISFSELQQMLNVDVVHLEQAARYIAKESNGNIQIIGTDLISSDYLRDVAVDIDRCLDEQEQISLAQMATKFDLPFELIQNLMSKYVGTIIQGILKRGYLLAPHYRSKQIAHIRGVLSACTIPCAVDALVAQLKSEKSDVVEVITQMIEAEELPGVLRGGEYAPWRFVESQRKELDDCFRRNKYIRFDQLPRSQTTKPLEYIQQEFPDAIGLATICIDPSLKHTMEAEMEASVAQFGWYDPTSSTLGDAATGEDWKRLIAHFLPRRDCIALGGYYVVAQRFINQVQQLLKRDAVREAERLVQELAVHAPQRGTNHYSGHEQSSVLASTVRPLIATSRLRSLVTAAHPELSDHQELLHAFLGFVMPQAEQMYTGVLENIAGGLLDPARREEIMQRKFDDLVTDLFVFQKSNAVIESALGEGDPLVVLLKRGLAVKVALPLANLITDHICWLHNLSYVPTREGDRYVLAPQQRREIVNELPKGHAVVLTKLWTLAMEANSTEFKDALESACQLITLPIRRPDKRKEKSTVISWKKATTVELATSTNVRVAVRAACMLTLQHVFKGAIEFEDTPEAVFQLVECVAGHAELFSAVRCFDALKAAGVEGMERFHEDQTTDEHCLQLMHELESAFVAA